MGLDILSFVINRESESVIQISYLTPIGHGTKLVILTLLQLMHVRKLLILCFMIIVPNPILRAPFMLTVLKLVTLNNDNWDFFLTSR